MINYHNQHSYPNHNRCKLALLAIIVFALVILYSCYKNRRSSNRRSSNQPKYDFIATNKPNTQGNWAEHGMYLSLGDLKNFKTFTYINSKADDHFIYRKIQNPTSGLMNVIYIIKLGDEFNIKNIKCNFKFKDTEFSLRLVVLNGDSAVYSQISASKSKNFDFKVEQRADTVMLMATIASGKYLKLDDLKIVIVSDVQSNNEIVKKQYVYPYSLDA